MMIQMSCWCVQNWTRDATHTPSSSWCIAHFVVIFNHIIQRYVYCFVADLMEILFIVCFSLLFGPMTMMMILLLQCGGCCCYCTQCRSINKQNYSLTWQIFDSHTMQSNVRIWWGSESQHIMHTYMLQNKAKFTDIVLVSCFRAKLQAHPTQQVNK